MKNIYNYIKENTLKIDEINSLDALVFSRLSYLHLENIEDKLPIKISELNFYLKEIQSNKKDLQLINLLILSERFKNLTIIRLQNILDERKEEQFFALTIKINSNMIFIAYRGTNKNIIGFKEDMNMSYQSVPSQMEALKYLNDEHAPNIYLGGHSKGGNLAMYAGVHTNYVRRCYIKKIYNFDGPGFLKIDNKFRRMKEKIINYFPESSLVGRLLENEALTVPIKSNKEGIEAHNLYSWMIHNNEFVEGVITKNSDDFYWATKKLNEDIPPERRKIIINYFFKWILQGKINSIKKIDLNEIKELFNHTPDISKEEKKILFNYLKLFIKVSLPKIKGKRKKQNEYK